MFPNADDILSCDIWYSYENSACFKSIFFPTLHPILYLFLIVNLCYVNTILSKIALADRDN